MKIENLMNYLFLYSISSIWIMIIINTTLTIAGIIYYKTFKRGDISLEKSPLVSILIPAHNEEKVISSTLEAILSLDYPNKEIIVINDNSSDNTGTILKAYKPYIKAITTSSINGGKGKSNALNIGLKQVDKDSKYIAIYDADNTPQKGSLKYLVKELLSNNKFAGVTGKFKTRNRDKNLLTRFINIETLSHQFYYQAGKSFLFQKSNLPGTNYVIKKEALLKVGGWNDSALCEDTDLSFKLYQEGYKIGFAPLAITWEGEPETIEVLIKQRSRWSKGNIDITFKYLIEILKGNSKHIKFDTLYFVLNHLLFLISFLISDLIFVSLLFVDYQIDLKINLIVTWLIAYLVFVIQNSIVLFLEKNENIIHIFLVCISYFTYSQLWLVVTIRGYFRYFSDKINQNEVKWYKTERF